MKFVLTIVLILTGLAGATQQASQSYNATATGSIYIPTLQSINIDLLHGETIQFANAEAYDKGQLLPAFIRATVISNVPYLVSVMASGPVFSATVADPEALPMPVSIISMRDNINNQFVNLSANSKPLLINKTNQLRSVYTIDANFNPGWTYSGGQYNTTLIFTLTAQ